MGIEGPSGSCGALRAHKGRGVRVSERVTERKFLGVIEVDSSTLVIGDPAYLLPSAKDGKPGVDYQSVIDADLSAFQPFANGLTMLFTIPEGDGPLGVYGEFEDGELWKVSVILDPIEIGEDE